MCDLKNSVNPPSICRDIRNWFVGNPSDSFFTSTSSLDDSRVILAAQLREIAWVGMKSERLDSIRIKMSCQF